MAERSVIFEVKLEQGQLLQALAKDQEALRKLKQEQKELDEARKKGTKSAEDVAKRTAEITVEQDRTRRSIAETKKEMRLLDTQQKANTGSIVAMRAKLSELNKEYDNLSKEERDSIDIGVKKQKQIADLTDELKELEGATGRNQRNVGNYRDAIAGLVGDFKIFGVSLNDAKGGLEKLRSAQLAQTGATNLASKGLNTFKIALISTGIGAIVVALGLLVSAFLSTQKGIDFVTKALQPLRVAFQTIIGFVQNTAIGIFEDLGKAISNPKQAFIDLGNVIKDNITNRITGLIKLVKSAVGIFAELPKALVTGDFDKVQQNLVGVADGVIAVGTGVEDATGKLQQAGKNFNDTLGDISDTAARLNQIYDELKLLRAIEASDLAKLNVQLQENQLIARDQSKTLEERKTALNNVRDAIQGQFDVQEKLLKLQIEELEIRQSLNDTTDEEKIELDKLRGALIELEARRAQQLRETLEIETQLRNLNKQYGANETSIKGLNTALSKLKKQIDLLPAGSPLFETLGKQADELQVKLNSLKNLYANLKEDFTEEDPDLPSPEEQLRRLGFDEGIVTEEMLRFADDLNKKFVDRVNKDFEENTVAPEGVIGAFGLTEGELEQFNGQLDKVSSVYNDFANGVNSIISANTQFRINKINEEEAAQIASINKQALSEEEKEKRITQIREQNEKKREGIERAAKKKQKAIAIISAIINGALGITQSIANTTLPFPASLAGPIAIGAATAAQIATIQAQQFAEGGIAFPSKTGGFIQGPSHANGGVPFRYARGGMAEAEGGEIILTKGVSKSPKLMSMASQINAAAGGVDFYKGYRTGGLVYAAGGQVRAEAELQRTVRKVAETPIVVSVRDILTGTERVTSVEQDATIG